MGPWPQRLQPILRWSVIIETCGKTLINDIRNSDNRNMCLPMLLTSNRKSLYIYIHCKTPSCRSRIIMMKPLKTNCMTCSLVTGMTLDISWLEIFNVFSLRVFHYLCTINWWWIVLIYWFFSMICFSIWMARFLSALGSRCPISLEQSYSTKSFFNIDGENTRERPWW